MANKVEFGMSELYIGKYTPNVTPGGKPTIAKPDALAGAVSFEIDITSSELKFHADDRLYYSEISPNAINATLTVARFPDWFKEAYLGYELTDSEVYAEVIGATQSPFVVMFTGDGDDHKTRHVFFNCIAGPIKRGHATVAGNKTIETESVELTIMGTEDTNTVHVAYAPGPAYNGLTTAIPAPAYA